MAKRNIQAEYLDLVDIVTRIKQIMDSSMKEAVADAERLVNRGERYFNLSEDEIELRRASSATFREFYDRFEMAMLRSKAVLSEYTAIIDNALNGMSMSKDEIQDAMDAIANLRAETEALNQEEERRNNILAQQDQIWIDISHGIIDASDGAEQLSDLDDILDDINAKLVQHRDNINNLGNVKGVNELKDSYDDILAVQEEINSLHEEQNDLFEEGIAKQRRMNAEMRQTKERWGEIVQIAKSVWNEAKQGFNQWIKIDNQITKIGRNLGLTTEQTRAYQKNVLDNYGALAARYGMKVEEIIKWQEEYNSNTNRAIQLTQEETSALSIMARAVGDTATNEMVSNMDKLGGSAQLATDYLAQNMARAQNYGLNATKTAEAFANNIKLASKHTFKEGIDGISKMTLLSQQLKFNMESVAEFSEKFRTVEGAIETSAQLQMLGGNMAMEFSNPLKMMNLAYTSQEEFIQTLLDGMKGMGTFNTKTGLMEFDPISQQKIREYSKITGISYEDLVNPMAQQARIGDIENRVGKGTFSDDDLAWIANKAQYKDGQQTVTYYDERSGEEKTVSVQQLAANKELLKVVKGRQNNEDVIRGDVSKIHDLLSRYIDGEGQKTSAEERYNGAIEQKNTFYANMLDPILNGAKNLMGLSIMAGGGTAAALGVAGLMGPWLATRFGKFANRKGMEVVSSHLQGNVVRENSYGYTANTSTWNQTTSQEPQSRGPREPQSQPKKGTFARNAKAVAKKGVRKGKNAVGKVTKFLGRNKKTAGLALLAAAAYGGYEYFTNDDNEAEVTPNNEIPNEAIQNNCCDNILSELQKHTVLLTGIAEKQGVSLSPLQELSRNPIINRKGTENTEDDGISIGGTIAQTGVLIGGNAIAKKYGTAGASNAVDRLVGAKIKRKGASLMAEKGLKKMGGKVLTKVGTKAVTSGIAGGPLGWGSIGVDAINMAGQMSGAWEEGSTTDKVLNIGSSTLEYAGYGAMIGSIIPGVGTAVGAGLGAAVGAVKGVITQYGDEIKEFGTKVYNGAKSIVKSTAKSVKSFFFGESNEEAQKRYDEQKFGEVNISDPQLMENAALATIKIHDTLLSMLGQQTKKEGVIGGSNGGGYGLLGGAIAGTGHAIGQIASGVGSGIKKVVSAVGSTASKAWDGIKSLFGIGKKDTTAQAKNTKSNASVKAKNKTDFVIKSGTSNITILPNNVNQNKGILAKTTVGLPTFINPKISSNTPQLTNIGPTKVDINISGTIKLDSGNQSANIDMGTLLKNTQFMNQLMDMIAHKFNERGNFGLSPNKNAAQYLQHGANSIAQNNLFTGYSL